MNLVFSLLGARLMTAALCAMVSVPTAQSKTPGFPIDAKTGHHAPNARPLPGGVLDDSLITERFESGQMPPAGWNRIIHDNLYPFFTWYLDDYAPYEGAYNAQVLYDTTLAEQDEWLISPTLNLTTGGLPWEVRFWWNMSYYWAVSPYDNYDLELRVSTDGGTTWLPDVLWVENTVGIFNTFEWYEAVISLSAYLNQSSVKLAWRYHGADGAQAGLDAISVEPPRPAGTILGTVTSDTDPYPPIPGATVEVVGPGLSTMTNAAGQYTLTGVPVGTFTLNFAHPAFVTTSLPNVAVTEDDTTVANVQMHPENFEFHDYLSTAPPAPITDLDTAYMNLDVGDGLTISDLDVTINITHTYVSDLTVWLETPWNQRILLAMNVGGTGENFVDTRFDDEAVTPIENGAAPFTGNFRPQEALAAADGMPLPGQWTLVVYDGYEFDEGTINNFTLHVASSAAAETPRQPIPLSFAFYGNYPNPFNTATQFRFDLPRAARVSLLLYDIAGRQVACLVNESLEAGAHSVRFDASQFPSGLYFARLSTSLDFVETRKVILLK